MMQGGLKDGLGALWVHACGRRPCCCRHTSKEMTVVVMARVGGRVVEGREPVAPSTPPPIQASTTHPPTAPFLPPFPSHRTQ